jgi:helix-turn-helix protein
MKQTTKNASPQPRKRQSRKLRVPFKLKSKDYYRGMYDCLDRLATLVYHGPIFVQVLSALAGEAGVTVPGVEKFERKDALKGKGPIDAEFLPPKKKAAKKPSGSTPEWIDKHEAAKRLGVSTRHLLDLAKEHGVRSERRRETKNGQMCTMLNAVDIEKLAYEREHPEVTRAAMARQVESLPHWRLPDGFPIEGPGLPRSLKPWLTLAEAEEYSGLPASVILKMAKSMQITAIDCGPRKGGRWRVRKSDLDSGGVETA